MISQSDIHNAKILIVDDQEVNVQLLEYLLANTGYRAVSSTTDPRSVVALHRRHDYDLIILDLHMPGMSGFEVMDALRPQEAEAYLPVLVVTADPDKKLAALNAGARDFLSKPFDPLEVLTRIRNMLEVRLLHREVKGYNLRLEQTVRERTVELRRFRRAIDATADAIFLIDLDAMKLLDVNDGACRMLGYTRAELLDVTPARLLLGEPDQLAAHAAAPSGAGQPPALDESVLERRDEVLVPVEIYWQAQNPAAAAGADAAEGAAEGAAADTLAGAAAAHTAAGADTVHAAAGADAMHAAGADIGDTPGADAIDTAGAAYGAGSAVAAGLAGPHDGADGAGVTAACPRQPGAILIAVARDITERRHTQEHLKRLAHYDSLTGLPNRTLFYQTLADAIELAQAKEWRIVVLFIALDRFRNINDSLGAALGDELLRQFSNRLVQCVRLRDTVGRLGGDEFALILTMTREQRDAVHMANEVRDALRTPFDLGGHPAALTASIGIAVYPDDANDPDTLIKYADTAMERAKQAGRDGYRFFTAGMNVQVLARLDLEMALRRALEQNEFVLYYQPKVNLHTGRVGGVEALLRWRRPGYGLVMPSDFVALLEDSGLIVRVGSWIIDTACCQIAAWCRSEVGAVRVAVNVSSRQFVDGDLYAEVRTALDKYQIGAELLELELTESALMSNAEHTIVVLGRLRALGVKIAIDDFGTGYSSLAYLQRFPIDKLKIDIAFVRNVTTNPNDAAIALAIISMAHSLKLGVIAEGVEALAQLEYLRRNRCDEIQGFYFSRPLQSRELGQLVEAGKGLPAEADGVRQPEHTLLIVDDDVNVLSSLYRLFRRDGYKILTAETPAEGFELLALQRVQVILCDQRMPGMSGTEFLSKAKEMYPETIRIILSGYTGLDAVIDSINRGAIYRFYTKPWDDAELRDNIRMAFHHYWLMNRPAHAGRAGDYETAI